MDEQVVLVTMSVREVRAGAELAALAAEVGASVAHLQQGDPSPARELTRLAGSGVRRVVVVGVATGPLAPGASWLRRVVAHWWRERGDDAPQVRVAGALLADLDPAAGAGERVARLVAAATPVTGAEAGLTSPAWEEVTAHRHQVLVCRGPRCSARGSDDTAEAVVLALMAHGLGDDDVLLTQTGCLLPCNHAPVVAVQPDDVWYARVGAGSVDRIVAEHLVDGRPVAAQRLARPAPRGMA
ncbi:MULTISPECIES: ferredoxin [Nocardioides]|uniref:(2Fe-2S) ferredoxin domain-containing protein n=2 Tax=Nocardioides kribbensis TaxID=305517 RepID=A0ABV1P1H9_9ACTN|nr:MULTISPECIES: (2Fe-2S) ferredoxin domain-containing protein [Nocardioides]MCM3516142.1 (2Fe-2S) ferredoxin domain-containing protein [Nocardioides sp. P86]